MFSSTSTSAAQSVSEGQGHSQSLFAGGVMADAANAEPTQGAHQSIVGELVFGKFIKEEDDSPLFLDTTPSSATSSLGNPVDDFFFKDDNSTPMFEFENPSNNANQWTSLFDDDIPIAAKDVQLGADLMVEVDDEPIPGENANGNSNANQSLEISQNSFLPTPTIAESKLAKPAKSQTKVSKIDHLGVVSYNRKNRSTPLSPVVMENDNPVAAKRARNTEAARRSRARKLLRMNQLEDKVEELLNQNSQLQDEVTRLKSLLSNR